MNKKYYILTILLLWAGVLFAQNISFTAQVSKSRVVTGEVFEITFSMNGNGDRFVPPGFSGFAVVSGPNVSTSMTSINGNTTTSNAYSYDLVANREGQYSIGPASIIVNGHTMATHPITITVVKGKPPGRQQQQQQQQMFPGGEEDAAPPTPADLSKSLFIRAVVDKTNVYQGEQLNISYRLYTKVGVLQSQVDKIPDLNGFWSQDVGDPRKVAQWHTEIFKGQRYNVADIKQTVLFPERSGNLTIDPLGMTFIARIPAPARDIMDQFFGGSYKDEKVPLKSQVVTIHVKPLPEAGKPDGYAGAVGSFTMSTSVDKASLKANEAMNYNVKITGSGNIKLFTPLVTNFPTDFEKYDPKVTDTVTNSVKGVYGSRIYNYLLIPRHGGKFTIEPLKFSYFNPATGKYTTLTSKPFQIDVAKGANEANVTALAGDKQDVKLLNKDIRYIKTDDTSLHKGSEGLFGSALYYILLLLGPVLFVAALIYRKWHEKANSDIVKAKSRKAGKIAAKHLANAKKQLMAKNSKAFYEDTFKGIYAYLSNKLNIPYANLDKETIADALTAKSVDEGLIKRLLDTLDLCDMARFAPVTGISEQEVFDRARQNINDIEDAI